jgi:hypothetical protein
MHFDPKQERKNFIKKDAKAQIEVRRKSPNLMRLGLGDGETEAKALNADNPSQKTLKVKKYFSLEEDNSKDEANNNQPSQLSPNRQSSYEHIPGRSKLKSKPTF